jgi:dihydroorotase-like cyclic amidohydrolase
MASILIANALTVNEGTSHHQDLLIRNGRIDAIGGDLSGKKATGSLMPTAVCCFRG